MTCTHCGRRLKHQRESGMGPVCELAVIGPRPRRRAQKTRAADEKQGALFA